MNQVFTQGTLNTVYVRTSDNNWVRKNWAKTYRSLSTGQSSMIWYPSQSYTLFMPMLAIPNRCFTVLLHLESTVSLKLYIFQRFSHISNALHRTLEVLLWKLTLTTFVENDLYKKSLRFQEPFFSEVSKWYIQLWQWSIVLMKLVFSYQYTVWLHLVGTSL